MDDGEQLSLLNARGGITNWEAFLAFVFGSNSGDLGRPISMLSFLLNDQYFPGAVESYRYTNVLIHCLTGIAVFLFCWRFLALVGVRKKQGLYISLVAFAWWLLAPLNVSTTLYVIQRMTQLSTLFVLVGLVFFLKGRNELEEGATKGFIKVFIGLYVFGGVSVLCKESGALIFVYAAVCEYTICIANNKKSNRILSAMIYIPVSVLIVYFAWRWGGITAGYQYRDFSLAERLLTETRVLVDYLHMIIVPIGGNMGLIQDDYVISKSLFNPITTILSLLLHVFLIASAWLMRKRFWPLFFGVSWFYLGHLLESTFIPLEIYFEHRNYLPMVGILLAVVVFLWRLDFNKVITKGVLALLVILSAFVCIQRTSLWGNPDLQRFVWLSEHPNSLRANTDVVHYFLEKGDYGQAENLLHDMDVKWPQEVHIDLLLFNIRCANRISVEASLSNIARQDELRISGGLLGGVLDKTLALVQDEVCNEANGPGMHQLLTALQEVENQLPPTKAGYFFMESKVFAKERNLEGAINALDIAQKYQENSVFQFAQSEIFYSAGLYEAAQEKIIEAIDIEEKKTSFKQQNVALYQTHYVKIESQLEKMK